MLSLHPSVAFLEEITSQTTEAANLEENLIITGYAQPAGSERKITTKSASNNPNSSSRIRVTVYKYNLHKTSDANSTLILSFKSLDLFQPGEFVKVQSFSTSAF